MSLVYTNLKYNVSSVCLECCCVVLVLENGKEAFPAPRCVDWALLWGHET